MERVKRRWWTWAVSLIAIAVIAGAVLSGLFQLAVLAVPSYREDLAAWVSEAAGRPVQIGGISLSWRGLTPQFDLSGITLYSEDDSEQISVERLSLGIGLQRLVVGELVPTRLELSGLRVQAQIDAGGRIRIAGFESDPAAPPTRRGRWLEALERFEQVRLQNCELRVAHAGFENLPLNLRLDDVELERTREGFEVEAELRLPAERGGELLLQAEIQGPVSQLARWQGRFEIHASELQLQGWLRPWLLPGTQVGASELDAHVVGDIDGGALARARIELTSEALVLARAGVLSSAQSMRAIFDYMSHPRGWRIDVTDLSFDEALLARGSLRHDRLDGRIAWDIDADQVELTRLAPWAGVWRDAPDWLYGLGRAHGDLEGLVLRYRAPEAEAGGAPQYSVRARLRHLGLRPDRRLGFAGLSGELSADESGGRLQLPGGALTLELPGALEHAVAFDRLAADLRWSRGAEGWQLRSEAFDWQLHSIEGRGSLALTLPHEEGSPVIDLQARFSAQDALDARPYMPRQWPDSLKTWLADAIERGRVPRGELAIRGPLADFPFVDRPSGSWRLELDAADVALDYAPGWPPLDEVRARLLFRGNSLAISGGQARVLGNRVVAADVRFDDFSTALMTVEAAVEGELARYYAFLRASPLREPLAALLDHTRASGAARVDLRLDVPLDATERTRVDGRVAIADAQLRYAELEPVTQLRGTLAFSERGVQADALEGRFADLPLTLRIDPQPESYGIIRGGFRYAPQRDGGGVSAYVPEFVRSALSGASQWLFELPLRERDSALVLSSDLVGTAVALPAPLGKPAEQAAPVWLRIGADEAAPLRVELGYDTRVAVNVHLAQSKQQWQVAGLHARLGAFEAPAAAPGHFGLDGRVDRLEPAPWLALLQAPALVAGDSGRNTLFDAVDLEAGSVVWRDYALRSTRLRYRPEPQGWRLELSGEGAQGELVYADAENGRIDANLVQLHLDRLPEPQAGGAAPPDAPDAAAAAGTPAPTEPAQPPLDPGQLPLLVLRSESLRMGGAELGRLELETARVPGGQSLRRLRLSGGIAQLELGGAWRRSNGQSSADLRFELETADARRLLLALGYAPNLEARRSRFSGEVAWTPAAAGLEWPLAAGEVRLAIDEGQLRAVQPGASRVLGLLNFYALPRRLTLNFDDVVGEGLAFDAIRGSFRLAGGDAVTQDLHIDGPSLSIDIRGKVGLAARDYDQRVTVYPDLSSGVTLGAVLLGGPAVGALVLLAQELLDKPLEQVTQFSYRISGPWDNPRVERLDAAGPG